MCWMVNYLLILSKYADVLLQVVCQALLQVSAALLVLHTTSL